MPTTIVLNNNYSYVKTDDKKLNTILWKALRFREKGSFHSHLYKQKLWDGFRDFYSKKTGRFLTGLWLEVQLALKKLDVRYDVVDQRKHLSFANSAIDNSLFEEYGYTLHDHQVDLINQALIHKRGIIQAPTGGGKSLIMGGILKCLPENTPTLLLSNSIDLTEQNYNVIKNLGMDVGIFHGKNKNPNYITCSTVQSAMKLEKILPKIRCLLVDEVHIGMSKQFVKIYQRLKNADLKFGISATPFKFGGTDKVQMYKTRGWFGGVFHVASAPDKKLQTKFLQDSDKLSSANLIFYPIKEPQIPFALYVDAINEGIAESHHFDSVILGLVEKIKGRSLILVERVKHGERLHEMIPNSIWISGKDSVKDRTPVLEKLRSEKGDLVVIATRHILNTGIDIMIHNLINCAGGKADHDIIQRIGRGLRKALDKKTLMYYDFIFDINPYLKKHSDKRVKIFKKEGHEVIIKDDIDF